MPPSSKTPVTATLRFRGIVLDQIFPCELAREQSDSKHCCSYLWYRQEKDGQI